MMMNDTTLHLPSHLVAALRQAARDRDLGLDHMVRGMLDRELMRLRSAEASHRRRVARADRLRGLLAPVIDAARDWSDLQAKLALFGYEFRPDGHVIALYDRATGEWQCRGADLGAAYPLLMRRFGGPLPAAANDNLGPARSGLPPVA